MSIFNDAMMIIDSAIKSALPDSAVKKALESADFGGRKIHLVAIGKAGWQMANAAYEQLGDRRHGHYEIRPLQRRDRKPQDI